MVLPLYEDPAVAAVTGDTLRPGGFVLTDRALGICRLMPGVRVVDVGCGTGATVGRLRRRFGLAAMGLDMSRTLLRKASPDALMMQGRAEALPVSSGCVAAVFCECALSLVPAPADLLKECLRVLSPGGFLILSDLYQRRPIGSEDRNNPVAPGEGGTSCASGALSRGALTRLVRENGFDIVVWEDHTRLLKELAARIVFAHGSMDRFWAAVGRSAPPGHCCGRPGYCLMICRKGKI